MATRKKKSDGASQGMKLPKGTQLDSIRTIYGRTLIITKSRKGFAAWVTGKTGKLVEVPIREASRGHSAATLQAATHYLNEIGIAD